MKKCVKPKTQKNDDHKREKLGTSKYSQGIVLLGKHTSQTKLLMKCIE